MGLVAQLLGQILEVLFRLERGQMVRPAWLEGYVELARYIGSKDKKGRKAKAWAVQENLYFKAINGTPHFSISDVDRAMRNGRAVETAMSATGNNKRGEIAA